MMLVDTSVLLDVLLDDAQFAAMSEKALKSARNARGLIICETVLAEVRPVFSDDAELEAFCADVGLEYRPCPRHAAVLAGTMYGRYLQNRGQARRVVPDFLIAAHALSCGYALLARDRGYYREYFAELDLVDPGLIEQQ